MILTRRLVECWPEEIAYQDVPTFRFFVQPGKRSSERRYQKKLAAWLDAHRDSLDLVCVSGLGEDAETAIRTLGKSCPVVLRAERAGRDGDCLAQIEARRARRIKRTCMKAAAFVGTSPTSHAELLAAGYPRDRVVAIPNGVALRPRRSAETHLAARVTLAEADPNLVLLSDQTEVALFVGRLTDRRRLGLLVLAWERVVASHTHAKLWIVGEGPELPALRRLIDSRNLAWSIQTPGVFDEPDVFYDAANLYLQPSTDDDRSGSILEAMAAELPIVATETSTNRQLLEACDTLVPGLGSDRETLARWSKAIERALDSPRHVARTNIVSHSIHRTAESHEQLFEELVAP